MKIVFERPDGSIGIITPVSWSGTIEELAVQDVPVLATIPDVLELTAEQRKALERCFGKEIFDALPPTMEMLKRHADEIGLTYSQYDYTIVADNATPTNRTFRNAWKRNGTSIDIDMPKAREIWRDVIRTARERKFVELDEAYLRADEIGNTIEKARIAADKQALRDLPASPAIENAPNPTALKAVWHSLLGELSETLTTKPDKIKRMK